MSKMLAFHSLGVAATDGLDLSRDNITAVCKPECGSSLKSIRSSISDAFPVESNKLDRGTIVYPATATIDLLFDTWNKLCLKDDRSNKLCYNDMRSWQQKASLTNDQLCSNSLLDTLRLDLSSEYTYNGDAAEAFSSLTASCHGTGFRTTSPTHIALSS